MTQQPAALAAGQTAAGGTTGWWRDAVIYQVYPRSFADANGDGESTTFVCTANTTGEPVRIPAPAGRVLLASGPGVEVSGDGAELPADNTARWTSAPEQC